MKRWLRNANGWDFLSIVQEGAYRIEQLERVLIQAREALEIIAAQHSGEVCGTSRSDGMAAIASASLAAIDEALHTEVSEKR